MKLPWVRKWTCILHPNWKTHRQPENRTRAMLFIGYVRMLQHLGRMAVNICCRGVFISCMRYCTALSHELLSLFTCSLFGIQPAVAQHACSTTVHCSCSIVVLIAQQLKVQHCLSVPLCGSAIDLHAFSVQYCIGLAVGYCFSAFTFAIALSVITQVPPSLSTSHLLASSLSELSPLSNSYSSMNL